MMRTMRFSAHTARRAAPRFRQTLAQAGYFTASQARVLTRSSRVSPFVASVRCFSDYTEVVPGLGDSITEGSIVEWVKNVGDYVNVDDEFVVLETDKVSVPLLATKAGKITSIAADIGDTVEIGASIITIDTSAEAPAADAAPPADAAPAPTPAAAAATAPKSEGPKAPAAKPAAPKPAAPKQAAPATDPTAAPGRTTSSVPLSRMRLSIARNLKLAQNSAAMLTTFNEIDMHNLMAMRSKYKDEFMSKHGAKLGFMSAFVKASSHALTQSPAVNALFDEENKQITYRNYVDIGVAVGTPTGLVVPVLRNCENMSFSNVEETIADFGARARAGKIKMDDMVGGTFTISNGGVYGSLFGTPIINPPQSAILGMHGIFKRPVVIDNEVVIRPMMYVALTYDHRIIDGQDAVLFLKSIKNSIEDPERLLLQL